MHLSQFRDFIAGRRKGLIAVFSAQFIQFFYVYLILESVKMLLESPFEGFYIDGYSPLILIPLLEVVELEKLSDDSIVVSLVLQKGLPSTIFGLGQSFYV